MSPISRDLALLGSGCCIGALISTYLYSRWRKTDVNRPRVAEDTRRAPDEVLFFPDSNFPCSKVSSGSDECRNVSCTRLHGRPHEVRSSMMRFLTHVRSAEHTVDLCIYMFTQSTIADLIKWLHDARIRVRIITDVAEDDADSSKLADFINLGIEIKSNKPGTGAKMHHKFLIIDNRLLLTGSFNFTNRAIVSNYENVMVTTESRIVKPFIEEFNRMWSTFQDHSKRPSRFKAGSGRQHVSRN